MKHATGSLSATFGFVAVCGLTALGCTPKQTDVHFPVAERARYVEVPGHTGMSADELRYEYYKGRRTLSHIRARCVTRPNADGSCAKSTDVRITAVEGAKFIDAEKGPAKPQLIAWIENLGTATTFDGIQPRAVARYALVVDAQPRANPEILLVAFPGEDRKGASATAIHYGNVYKCHNYGPRLISDADYQVCGYHRTTEILPAPRGLGNATMLTSMLTWMPALGYGDPTWFSCASGCCTSTATIAEY